MKETSVIHQILNTPMITPIINFTVSLTYFCMLFLHVLVQGKDSGSLMLKTEFFT